MLGYKNTPRAPFCFFFRLRKIVLIEKYVHLTKTRYPLEGLITSYTHSAVKSVKGISVKAPVALVHKVAKNVT